MDEEPGLVPGGRAGCRAATGVGRPRASSPARPGPAAGCRLLLVGLLLGSSGGGPTRPAAADPAPEATAEAAPGAARGAVPPWSPELDLLRTALLAGDGDACAQQAGRASWQQQEGPEAAALLLLAGECHRQRGAAAAALRAYSQLFETARDPRWRLLLHERAGELALARLGPAEAAALRGRVPGVLAQRYLELRAALEAHARGQHADAARLLLPVRSWLVLEGQTRWLGALAPTAGAAAAGEDAGTPDRGSTVVALLPLTGSARRLGASVLDALLVAAGTFGPEGARDEVTLRVVDTASDPAQAVQQLAAAAADPAVVAALGPFDGETAPAISDAAAAQGLPLLLLAVEGSRLAPGARVFRTFSSHRLEVAELVAHGRNTLGLSRAVVLRPDHGYGETLGRLFREAWGAAGGTLVGEVVYPAGATNLAAPVKQLAALPRAELLFLPDAHQQVGIAASFLAAGGFWSTPAGGRAPPVKKGKKLRPLQLFGTSAWYDARLLTTAGSYLQGAVFPTAFAAEQPRPEVASFVAAFTRAAGRPPGAVEAFARDAYGLVAAVCAARGGSSRDELAARLHAGCVVPGVTALCRFDPQGEPVDPPPLLRISAETFQIVP